MTYKLMMMAALLSVAGLATASVQTPASILEENFASADGSLPEGWVSYGSGNAPADAFAPMFSQDGPYYVIGSVGGFNAAWSLSTFRQQAESDEWLVSPKIHIDSEMALLTFSAYVTGSYETAKYRVYVSEAGNAMEEFNRKPEGDYSLKGWGNSEVSVKEQSISLSKYAGKDIHVAFVNRSKDAGLFGVGSVSVAPYRVQVEDKTEAVVLPESETPVVLSVSICTPMKAAGFNVSLEASDGYTETRHVDHTLGLNPRAVTLTLMEGRPVPASGVSYTVTITPDLEGAAPTVVTGEIRCPEAVYAPVTIIEEFTGAWCTNCPRGHAFMNFYQDWYDGSEGRGKAIGIAIHNGDGLSMSQGSYESEATAHAGVAGYPSAFFGRRVTGDPTDRHILDQILASPSYSKIHIDRVDFKEGNPKVKVRFTVTNAVSKNDMNQNVAFVVIENGVPSDAQSIQINGLSGIPRGSVEATYGPELWPYFKPYCEGSNPMNPKDMIYNHVARGIFPGYKGLELTSSCEANEGVTAEYEFNMPAQVADPSRAAVIAVLLDPTNAVLTADEVHAEDFNKTISGVESVAVVDDDITMFAMPGQLAVALPAEGVATIYAADGTVVYRSVLPAGESRIDTCALSGIYVVEAVSGASRKVMKIAR